jgi:hypothetical protein
MGKLKSSEESNGQSQIMLASTLFSGLTKENAKKWMPPLTTSKKHPRVKTNVKAYLKKKTLLVSVLVSFPSLSILRP